MEQGEKYSKHSERMLEEFSRGDGVTPHTALRCAPGSPLPRGEGLEVRAGGDKLPLM